MFNISPQLMQLLKSGGNPQQLLMGMMQNGNMGNNPIMQNVMGMMNSGNTAGIEQIVRNVCKQRNLDPDELYRQVQSQFKM